MTRTAAPLLAMLPVLVAVLPLAAGLLSLCSLIP